MKNLNKVQIGRSMVEMLGVLAIVGVLSVGSIAGYSKAMFKYKMNKYALSYNTLLNDLLDIKNSLDTKGGKNEGGNTIHYYGNFFKKLNKIPEGFKYVSDEELKDMFNNSVLIYQYSKMSRYSNPEDFPGGIRTEIKANKEGQAICHQLLNIAKENSQNLSKAMIYIDKSSSKEITILGDKKCVSGAKCLNKLTLADVENFCYSCNNQSCYVYTLWRG